MLLVLQAALGSWRLAGLAFSAIVASLSGGVLGALVGGGVLSLGAILGFLAVFALATRQVVVLVRHAQDLASAGNGRSKAMVAMRAAADRLRPIITTVLATAAAVLAFRIVGDVPGLELAHAMAPVILGGLVTTTLVTLFVVPSGLVFAGRPRDLELGVEHPEPQPIGAS
jgi:multidrug efflux pump subunit AcrB